MINQETKLSRRARAVFAVAGDRPINYYPRLAIALHELDRYSGTKEALMISQMLAWESQNEYPDGFIPKTRKEWTEATALSRHKQENACKHLSALGLLEIELKGLPCKNHYRLNLDRLSLLVELGNHTSPEREAEIQAEFKRPINRQPMDRKSSQETRG